MKRYRLVHFDFDTRGTLLGLQIEAGWEPAVRAQWEQNQARVRAGLQDELGAGDWPRKERDLVELGPTPISVVSYHNTFLRQARAAFVLGAQYPALTAACCLGEKILNHLVNDLKGDFSPPTAESTSKNRMWKELQDLVISWGILVKDVPEAFEKLRHLRNANLHFNASLEQDCRAPALDALQGISTIVQTQFGVMGPAPWLMCTGGVTFLRGRAESQPFVREFYVRSCALVSPDHELIMRRTGPWEVIDHGNHDGAGGDEDFLAAFESLSQGTSADRQGSGLSRHAARE